MQESPSGILGAVFVGNTCLDTVIVADRTAGLFCLSCSAQKTCRHVKAAQGDNQTAAEWNELQQQSWKQQFEHRFGSLAGIASPAAQRFQLFKLQQLLHLDKVAIAGLLYLQGTHC